jgi:hypothetical protein
VIDQPGLILAHPEKVVLLRDLTHGTETIGTFSLREVFLRPEPFTRNTIPSLVIILIDLPPVVKVLKDLLNHLLMAVFGGSDEVIVRDVQPFPEGLKPFDHLITVSLRIHPPFLGGLLHLLAMLVGAREKEDLVTLKTLVASQDIRSDRGIGMPNMGNVVHIIDGCGDVKGPLRFLLHEW